MFGSKKTTHEDLIYADPLHADKPVPSRRRGLRALIAALAALILVALVLTALYFSIHGQGHRYQTALHLLTQKEYTAAAAEFEQLEDFRDSEKLLTYANALALVARTEVPQSIRRSLTDQTETAETLEEAAEMLESLGDFSDARAKAAECRLTARRLRLQQTPE